MSSDLIGRRRASEQRLDRARSLELSLKEKTDVLVRTMGMTIDQLDFDGSLRATLTALAGVAARRTHFDIIVTLPDAPFAMRIQHVNNVVSAEVLIQGDDVFEPVTDQTQKATTGYAEPARSADPEPAGVPEHSGTPEFFGTPEFSGAAEFSGASGIPAAATPPSAGTAHPGSTAGANGSTGVASDLAALLWQSLDDMPS